MAVAVICSTLVISSRRNPGNQHHLNCMIDNGSLVPRPATFWLHERCHMAWDLKSRVHGQEYKCNRKVIMCVGDYSCNSETPSKGSKSTLLVAFVHSPFEP